MIKEEIVKAWAVKNDVRYGNGIVAYEVWYWAEKLDGQKMENVFEMYKGEPDVRYWNLAQQMAGKLNRNTGE